MHYGNMLGQVAVGICIISELSFLQREEERFGFRDLPEADVFPTAGRGRMCLILVAGGNSQK